MFYPDSNVNIDINFILFLPHLSSKKPLTKIHQKRNKMKYLEIGEKVSPFGVAAKLTIFVFKILLESKCKHVDLMYSPSHSRLISSSDFSRQHC